MIIANNFSYKTKKEYIARRKHYKNYTRKRKLANDIEKTVRGVISTIKLTPNISKYLDSLSMVSICDERFLTSIINGKSATRHIAGEHNIRTLEHKVTHNIKHVYCINIYIGAKALSYDHVFLHEFGHHLDSILNISTEVTEFTGISNTRELVAEMIASKLSKSMNLNLSHELISTICQYLVALHLTNAESINLLDSIGLILRRHEIII